MLGLGRFFRCIVFLFIGCSVLWVSHGDEYEDVAVEELYAEALQQMNQVSSKRDYKEAVRLFRLAALAGHAPSQSSLAECYERGLGVRKSLKQAAKWRKQAAEGLYPIAMAALGKSYLWGLGVKEDREKAKELFEQVIDPKARFEISVTEYELLMLRRMKADCFYLLGLMLVEDEKENRTEIERAFGFFEKASSLGHVNATLYLALAYVEGTYVDVNAEKAKRFFDLYELILSDSTRRYTNVMIAGLENSVADEIREAFPEIEEQISDQVDVLIANFVQSELDKEGDERNLSDEDALMLLKNAVEAEQTKALFESAILLSKKREDPESLALAYQYMSEAAKDDWRLATFNKGVMLVQGLGVEADAGEGELYIQRAAEYGLYVARAFIDGTHDAALIRGVDALKLEEEAYEAKTPQGLYSHTKRLERSGSTNPKRLFKRYLRAAKGGSLEALYEVGNSFYLGKGVGKDLKKAHAWMNRALEVGNSQALFRLAYMYGSGEGVDVDEKRSYDLYSMIGLKDSSTLNNLATIYEAGRIVPEDQSKAFDMYLEAAEKGGKVAMKNLAKKYENGEGVEKNEEQAIYWNGKAAELGIFDCTKKMVKYWAENAPGSEEESGWIELAAEQGDPASMVNIAHRYFKGQGVVRSFMASLYWASAYMNVYPLYGGFYYERQYEAVSIMGDCLAQRGWSGTNFEEAASLYKLLSDNGDLMGMLKLGQLHSDGVLEKSKPKKALKLYRQAYEESKEGQLRVKGTASYFLSLCYGRGLGVEVNRDKQLEWLRIASDLGHVQALYDLARIYLSGEVEGVDRQKGALLMSKAAKKKYVPAMFWFAVYHLENDIPSKQAMDWLRQQARDGNSKARKLLKRFDIPLWETDPNEAEPEELDEENTPIIDMGVAYLIACPSY